MLPYFLKKSCDSKDPLEKLKFVMTNTVASFYYMNLFLKPVFNFLFSSIPLLVKLWKLAFQMELKFIANRFLIILQSVISWLLDPKIHIDITAIMLFQLMRDLIP